MSEADDDRYDLNQIIIQPLYFGLVANILIPIALLFVCYYLHNHYTISNQVGELANSLFYLFVVAAVGQAGLALWWRSRRLGGKLIGSVASLQEDLVHNLLLAIRPIFILIASISVYGYAYFLLTGRFTEGVVFVFFSFIVFQIVRPRPGSVGKLIERQKKLFGDS